MKSNDKFTQLLVQLVSCKNELVQRREFELASVLRNVELGLKSIPPSLSVWSHEPPTIEELQSHKLCVVHNHSDDTYLVCDGEYARKYWSSHQYTAWLPFNEYVQPENRYCAEPFAEQHYRSHTGPTDVWVVYDTEQGVIRVDYLTKTQAIRIAEILNNENKNTTTTSDTE